MKLSGVLPLLVAALPIGCSSLFVEEDPTLHIPTGGKIRDDVDDLLQYMDGVWSVTTVDDVNNNNNGASFNRSSTTKSFGYSNIPFNKTMSKGAHFPIGSNSKLYTTVAIYQLYEQGKLDVDADIATMLDEQDYANFGAPGRKFCPRVGRSIYVWSCEKMTLRQLMSMSSGIYPAENCNALPNAPNQCNPDPYFVSRGSIGLTVGTFLFKPLMFKPGTDYQYSNPNFILAAYFVEKYSGMTFRDYLHTHICSKIGLTDTYFDFFNEALGIDTKRPYQHIRYYDNQTSPYELMAVGANVLQIDRGVASGTGGILSTVHDQATFWYTLFDKDTKGAPLLTPDSQKALLTPWKLAGVTDTFRYPNGTVSPVWWYYTQGTVILCDAEDCRNGPRFIQYTGGTITVHTANLLDLQTFKMVQVWTSTLVATTDRQTFNDTFESQTGFIIHVGPWVGRWLLPKYNNPTWIAFHIMYEDYESRNGVEAVAMEAL